MLAAAAVLWLIADASLERLSATPPGPQSGVAAYAGFQIAQTLHPHLTLGLTGRAGAAYVDDWRPVFEGTAELSWREIIDAHAGLRHDDRLRREGTLADFRDPTGRMFFGVGAFPFRKGPFRAGAAIDYDRALPGVDRLPSGVRATAIARLRWRSP